MLASKFGSPYTVLTIIATAVLTACSKPSGPPPDAEHGPPQVGYVEVQAHALVLTTELPGRTSAFMIADVRPQVGGLIQSRPFREGSDVKAGDVLYQIDPAIYRANVDSAQAALKRAQASLTTTQLKAGRYKELVAIKAVSQQDYDDASSALQQGEADVAAARAALETNKINLAYTRVTSPISGRIGRSSVTAGALVTPSQPNALATVQRLDPIYVDVTQSSTSILQMRRALESGQLTSSGANSAKVKLVLEDGSTYSQEGELKFSEVTVDQGTGAVTVRAVFPNPRAELLPGMYVHAVLEEGVKADALLVPQQGVTRDSAGKPIAMVVGADGKAALRQLTTERAIGDKWLVTAGLKPGDKVIVEGLQKIRPGVPVSATPVSGAASGVADLTPAATPRRVATASELKSHSSTN